MRNEAKIKQMGLEKEVRYYYLKFGEGAENVPDGFLGVATICIIRMSANNYVRGIAFCSPKDQFNRKLGRAIALGRAIKAEEYMKDTEPILNRSSCGVLIPHGYFYLSQYNSVPTPYERKLFEGKEGRDAENKG